MMMMMLMIDMCGSGAGEGNDGERSSTDEVKPSGIAVFIT